MQTSDTICPQTLYAWIAGTNKPIRFNGHFQSFVESSSAAHEAAALARRMRKAQRLDTGQAIELRITEPTVADLTL
jgi:hypothetical protein